ncbi:MAG: hypothetical protein ACKPCI_05320 [Dolichospermum sp.]
MSNKQKYKPGVKITMNKFHKFWVGTTTVLLTAVMLTSCSGGTSSNTGGGRSSNTSSTGGTEITPVTPITSNTTPQRQRSITGGSRGNTGTNSEFINNNNNLQLERFQAERDAFWEEQRQLDLESQRQSNCLATLDGC